MSVQTTSKSQVVKFYSMFQSANIDKEITNDELVSFLQVYPCLHVFPVIDGDKDTYQIYANPSDVARFKGIRPIKFGYLVNNDENLSSKEKDNVISRLYPVMELLAFANYVATCK